MFLLRCWTLEFVYGSDLVWALSIWPSTAGLTGSGCQEWTGAVACALVLAEWTHCLWVSGALTVDMYILCPYYSNLCHWSFAAKHSSSTLCKEMRKCLIRGDLICVSLPQVSLWPLWSHPTQGLVASAGNGVFSIRFSSHFVIHD